MNHKGYHWSNEPMLRRYEMHEGALEQARLLQKLGLWDPDWRARLLNVLADSLKTWRKGVHGRRSLEPK